MTSEDKRQLTNDEKTRLAILFIVKGTPSHWIPSLIYDNPDVQYIADLVYKMTGQTLSQYLEGPGTMNFSLALAQCKDGYKIAREGWNGKGMYVTYKPGYPDGIEANEATRNAHGLPEGSVIVYCPYLEMKTADNKLVPWLASQTDILADDWDIIL